MNLMNISHEHLFHQKQIACLVNNTNVKKNIL